MTKTQAELYDYEWGGRTEDLPFYVGLGLGKGRVLEIGCGTGRVTIPLARAGVDVFGVDKSIEALCELSLKLDALGEAGDRATGVLDDALSLWLVDRKFPLVIIPFHLLNYFTDPIQAGILLHNAAACLEPGGLIAFDATTGAPPELYAEQDLTPPQELPDGTLTWQTGSFDPDTKIREVSYHYSFRDETAEDGRGEVQSMHFRLRGYSPEEVHEILRQVRLVPVYEAAPFAGPYTIAYVVRAGA